MTPQMSKSLIAESIIENIIQSSPARTRKPSTVRTKIEVTTTTLRKAVKNQIQQIIVSQVRKSTSPHTKLLTPKAVCPLQCKWRQPVGCLPRRPSPSPHRTLQTTPRLHDCHPGPPLPCQPCHPPLTRTHHMEQNMTTSVKFVEKHSLIKTAWRNTRLHT